MPAVQPGSRPGCIASSVGADCKTAMWWSSDLTTRPRSVQERLVTSASFLESVKNETMNASLIYTTEPLATRALAAEIRHEPARFIAKIEEVMGVQLLGRFVDVQAEQGKQKIDVALTFADPNFVVGIEAKFDHTLTEDQVDRESTASGHLIVLLLDKAHAPEWVSLRPRVSVMTWEEALACFSDSRLTLAEVRAARSSKSTVEARLRELMDPAQKRLGNGWVIDSERGGSGMPAVNFYSPWIGGRQLRAVLQVAGRGMPPANESIRLRFSVGVSVEANYEDYPQDPATAPEWVDSVHRLRAQVIGDRVGDLQLSKRRPSSAHANQKTPNGRAHARKLAIVNYHFSDRERWLTTGYIDWIVGPASERMLLEQVETLAEALVTILEEWFRVELTAHANSTGPQ